MPTLQKISELDNDQLLAFAIDAFRRTLTHHALWFREAEKELGLEGAFEAEERAFERGLPIHLKRLGKATGFEVREGLPAALQSMNPEQILTLIDALSVNWLVNDGVWFQAVEETHDMATAKRCNDAAWSGYSPFEARRIKKLLDLPDEGGLEALARALEFRLYARVNEQAYEWQEDGSLIFRMVNCRVQAARKRKGLDDYPCKSGGVVEYTTFAAAIDSRILCECIACPPDEHPEGWFCAWRFTLSD
jgi:hypothetical protein